MILKKIKKKKKKTLNGPSPNRTIRLISGKSK